MTFRELAMRHLADHGLTPEEVHDCMERCAQVGLDRAFTRWNDPADGAPAHVISAFLSGIVFRGAADHLADAKPNHWLMMTFKSRAT